MTTIEITKKQLVDAVRDFMQYADTPEVVQFTNMVVCEIIMHDSAPLGGMCLKLFKAIINDEKNYCDHDAIEKIKKLAEKVKQDKY